MLLLSCGLRKNWLDGIIKVFFFFINLSDSVLSENPNFKKILSKNKSKCHNYCPPPLEKNNNGFLQYLKHFGLNILLFSFIFILSFVPYSTILISLLSFTLILLFYSSFPVPPSYLLPFVFFSSVTFLSLFRHFWPPLCLSLHFLCISFPRSLFSPLFLRKHFTRNVCFFYFILLRSIGKKKNSCNYCSSLQN